MNAFYQAKFKELCIEFTRYLTDPPEFAADIPQDAQVVLLDSHDSHYSLQAIQADVMEERIIPFEEIAVS